MIQIFHKIEKIYFIILLTFLCVFFFTNQAKAGTNIDSTNYWAWNDFIGWIDFFNTGTVSVSSSQLSGYASSSVGDISLDCNTTRSGNICAQSSYQVKNDGSGLLSNFAWNDTYGWISFCGGLATTDCPGTQNYQVQINASGTGSVFAKYAWNDILGWISFNCVDPNTCGTSNYKVGVSWVSTSTNGYVDSTTFDSGVASGTQLNSIIWYGPALPAGTSVGFQLAVSSTSNGPWAYKGPDDTSASYFGTSPVTGPSTSISLRSSISGYTLFNNFRYFRYRVTLFSNQSQTLTPQVDDVVVNWSP